MKITEFTIDRYEDVVDLMIRSPGISVRDADSRAGIERYLARNPGFSFVAEVEGRVVACALCGHDGRRGYLQHVVVEPQYRHRGIAHALITRCLDQLEKVGIVKTHIDVFIKNESANAYWKKSGWTLREDINRYSFVRSNNPNS